MASRKPSAPSRSASCAFSTFLIFNAFNTVAAFSFFIVVYHLFGGKTADAGIWPTLFGSVGALITTFAVIPTVAWMSGKMGKKNAFMLSQGISIIGYVLLWFLMVPGKPWMFMFALPFFSFGIGGLFTLMMSMTADVCDLDELATGKRREGIFGAIYWWMVKFGFAIAGLLSGAIMSLVAFTPGAASAAGRRGGRPAAVLQRRADLRHAAGDVDHARLRPRREARHRGARRAGAAQAARRGGVVAGLGRAALAGRARPAAAGRRAIAAGGQADGRDPRAVCRAVPGGLYGLCFSAYPEGQRAPATSCWQATGRPPHRSVAPHTRWVRSFACTEGHEAIPRLARTKGLKTMVGAWLSHDRAATSARSTR
jgi:GPH family glycoside/pentoside/hexuronide:cation symporter